MQQRYKVFIYDSPVIIGNDLSHFPKNANFLDWNELEKDSFFKKHLNSTGDAPVYIFTEKPSLVLESFQERLKFIEAAGGFVEKGEDVLVIKRLGRTDLPKGKLEKGEEIEEAAIREVEEECGIDKLKITETLNPSYHCYEMKGNWSFKKTYWFRMTSETSLDPKPQVEEDIEWVKWIPKKDLTKIMRDTYPSILEVLSNALNL